MNENLIYIGAGALIGWFFPRVIYFFNIFAPYRYKSLFKAAVRSLEHLNTEIFSCFLKLDYPERAYLYERRIHVQKNKFLSHLLKLQMRSQKNNFLAVEKYQISLLKKLFDLMMSYSQLRWRVGDHSIFEICTEEMNAILLALNQGLYGLTAKQECMAAALLEEDLRKSIDRFEDVYHSVLTISSKEPLVFLLFISDLKDFVQVLTLYKEEAHD